MSPTMNIMTPPEEITFAEPSEQSSRGGKKTKAISRLTKPVSSRKTPLHFLLSSSNHSRGTAATEVSSHFSEDVERNVRFSADPVFHFTLSRKDYTPEELRASWFQDEEYSKITKACCNQIKKMENGQIFKDKKYSSRGLESHTRLASISKTQNRKTAVDAVLDEQDEQRELGIVDEEVIAQRYQKTTSSCQLWASIVGLRDKRAAEEYMDCFLS
jgi:hypothetical protein